MSEYQISRRTLLKALLALGISGSSLTNILHAATQNTIVKKIPSSDETIPVIGLGTSRTFDALGDDELLLQLKKVLHFFSITMAC